jgi:mono/diheme cytochrome c family protein
VEQTAARLERGKYLAHHVALCMDCHSTRDWSKLNGPMVDGTWGKGGEIFDQKMGFPGKYLSANITPYHLKDWTDGELYRVITTGVSKDGHALFPVMPYLNYGKMDKEDIYAIIAYIRSLPEIANDVPKSEGDFPMSIIVNTIPKKASHEAIPSKSDKLAYGKYLLNAAACAECHTQRVKGEPVEGMDLAGGMKFVMPGGDLYSKNITPDTETGIGDWTEDDFVKKFKIYADSSYTPPAIKPGEFQSIMPWQMYGGLTEEDLKAMFAYLRTVKPVKNKINLFEKHQ